jgi:hypothetical protein
MINAMENPVAQSSSTASGEFPIFRNFFKFLEEISKYLLNQNIGTEVQQIFFRMLYVVD